VVDAGEQVLAGAVALVEPLLAGHVAETVGAQLAGGARRATRAAVEAILGRVGADAVALLQVLLAGERADALGAELTGRASGGAGAAVGHAGAQVDAGAVAVAQARLAGERARALGADLGGVAGQAASAAVVWVLVEVDAAGHAPGGPAGARAGACVRGGAFVARAAATQQGKDQKDHEADPDTRSAPTHDAHRFLFEPLDPSVPRFVDADRPDHGSATRAASVATA